MSLQATKGAGVIVSNDGTGGVGPPGPPGPSGSSSFLGLQVLRAPTASYTPGANVTNIVAIITGGGGSGARSAGPATSSVGGGGGAGASRMFSATVTPSVAIPITIGVGGAAPGAGNTDGAAGTATTMLGRTANGGAGGLVAGIPPGPPITVAGGMVRLGGLGGVSTGVATDLGLDGEGGAAGVQVTNANMAGGRGGSSYWGGGGWGYGLQTGWVGAGPFGGQAGHAPGAGGGGTGFASTAGAGADGVIVIWEYGTAGGGGGAVSSVFARVGAVVAALGDYLASLITNDSLVPGATVADALNTINTFANAVTVALSEILGRIVASVNFISGLTATRYEGAADPFVGATQVTLCALVSPEFFSSNFQMIAGNNTGGGGGVSIATFYDTVLVQAWDATITQRTEFVNGPMVRLWQLIVATVDTSGADMVIEIWINGSRLKSTTIGGAGGALPAGGNFTIGAGPGGGNPAGEMRIQGAGYALRIASPQELADQFEQALITGALPDLSGGALDAGYQILAPTTDPGDPWVPFVGAGNLTRTGAAPTTGTDTRPLYRTG